MTLLSDALFKVLEGTASRSFADRMKDWRTPQQFDAVGDGVADDHPAIMAAIKASGLHSGHAFAAYKGGRVVFPPGRYSVSEPLYNDSGGRNDSLLWGSDWRTTQIVGDFAGYVFDVTPTSDFDAEGEGDFPPGGPGRHVGGIRGLAFINERTAPNDSAAIRMVGQQQLIVENCYFKGYHGVDHTHASYCCTYVNCVFEAGVPGEGVGLFIGQGAVRNCTFIGWDIGVQVANVGVVISGNKFYRCNTGIRSGFGRTWTGSDFVSDGMSALLVENNDIEECNVGMFFRVGGAAWVSGNRIHGEVGPDGVTAPTNGILMMGNVGSVYSGNNITVKASSAGFEAASGLWGSDYLVFLNEVIDLAPGAAGSNWKSNLGTGFPGTTFINCNNPDRVQFVNLPGEVVGYGLHTPVEGELANVTDATTATYGATVSSGGGSNHVRARMNNSDQWKVIGK